MTGPEPILIVFDAQCLLCSAWARFVLTRDKNARFRFAAMQGAVGAEMLRHHGIDPADPTTMLVVTRDNALRDSDAAIAVLVGLGGPWRLAGAARWIPRGLRDSAYRWIARNRYRLFGRLDVCWVPHSDWSERML